MKRSFAFLRAVNVGGRIAKMDRVRSVFEELGLAGVDTFIASGNVVFDATRGGAARLERRIERALADAFGFDLATFVRAGDELRAIAAHEPFDDSDGRWFVGFTKGTPPADAKRRVEALATPAEPVHMHAREVYWRPPAGRVSDSTLSGGAIEKALGGPLTMRNINTVHRMVAKYLA